GATERDFVIRMNSRLLLNAACAAAGLSGESIRQYLRLLDKKSKMTPEAFAAASSTISTTDPLSLIENPGTATEVENEKKRLLDRITALAERGVSNIVFDTSITRGFDYYTGMVFEVYDTSIENPRALFGGGRYDGLVALFGGDPIPAVGFALGDVTLADFLDTHSLVPSTSGSRPELYLGTPLASDIPAAQAFADTLRKEGCRVFVNLTPRGLGDQIKDAVKRSIPFFAAYGANEVTSQTLRMKTLATGEEMTLSASDVPARVRAGN
ncbi:MAG: ATP phosphoribosyltransferase regulatory subunit, partial [Candidatus Kaiserbacteria bacterium]|nr:ATP phosphoribosyltransferase regulatory subunit [Candidatus Kaiserbacteria bacterium]